VRPSVIPVISSEGLTITWFNRYIVRAEFNVYIVIATDVFIPLLMTVITEGLTITWFNRYIVRAEFNVYIVIATDVFIPL
jgi:hypothetical protein